MKKTNSKKPLQLSSHTIRALDGRALDTASGGGEYTFGPATMCCDSARTPCTKA